MDLLEYRIGRFILQPYRQLLDGGAPVAIGRKALEKAEEKSVGERKSAR